MNNDRVLFVYTSAESHAIYVELLSRDTDIATSVCLSVGLSDTLRYSIETA